jgi:hypothetical protein
MPKNKSKQGKTGFLKKVQNDKCCKPGWAEPVHGQYMYLQATVHELQHQKSPTVISIGVKQKLN